MRFVLLLGSRAVTINDVSRYSSVIFGTVANVLYSFRMIPVSRLFGVPEFCPVLKQSVQLHVILVVLHYPFFPLCTVFDRYVERW